MVILKIIVSWFYADVNILNRKEYVYNKIITNTLAVFFRHETWCAQEKHNIVETESKQ